MADRKNDQERDELFRRIYKIATDLVHAGHVAEWDFKSYVLGTMFYRYISENFAAYINKGEIAAALARGEINPQFDYAKLPDDIAEPALPAPLPPPIKSASSKLISTLLQ